MASSRSKRGSVFLRSTVGALASHSAGLRCPPESQRDPMTDYVVKPLDANSWEAFSRLVERHNGVFGGCWCTWFHTFHAEKTFTAEGNRALKKRLVEEGRAHAGVRR